MKIDLKKQFIILVILYLFILYTLLKIFIPNSILSQTEESLYNRLILSITLINKNKISNIDNSEIAYIYINDKIVYTSSNFSKITKEDANKILGYIKQPKGNFTISSKKYYYVKIDDIISITDDKYIKQVIKNTIKSIKLPIMLSILIVSIPAIIWITIIVLKILKLKEKSDNIDNNRYNHKFDFYIDDELKKLNHSLENMRESFMKNEEYKNELYQNISHDFKTPLSIIKSYTEAREDNMCTYEEYMKVIKEQSTDLERRVRSLLYLNKLDYLSNYNREIKEVDISKLVKDEIKKFKYLNREISIKYSTDNSKIYGNYELLEGVFDNILTNSYRYANKIISITIKNGKIIIYNDGEHIKEDIIDYMFTPFRKGIKGDFGLGLSIVKKSLKLINYNIYAVNEKVGVSFIISKK
jgi:hypothetical protein